MSNLIKLNYQFKWKYLSNMVKEPICEMLNGFELNLWFFYIVP